MFTSSREYFIPFRSFSSNTGPLFFLRILSYTETSTAGIQFPQFLLISIDATLYRRAFLRSFYPDYNLEFYSQLNCKTAGNRFKQQIINERKTNLNRSSGINLLRRFFGFINTMEIQYIEIFFFNQITIYQPNV